MFSYLTGTVWKRKPDGISIFSSKLKKLIEFRVERLDFDIIKWYENLDQGKKAKFVVVWLFIRLLTCVFPFLVPAGGPNPAPAGQFYLN